MLSFNSSSDDKESPKKRDQIRKDQVKKSDLNGSRKCQFKDAIHTKMVILSLWL